MGELRRSLARDEVGAPGSSELDVSLLMDISCSEVDSRDEVGSGLPRTQCFTVDGLTRSDGIWRQGGLFCYFGSPPRRSYC